MSQMQSAAWIGKHRQNVLGIFFGEVSCCTQIIGYFIFPPLILLLFPILFHIDSGWFSPTSTPLAIWKSNDYEIFTEKLEKKSSKHEGVWRKRENTCFKISIHIRRKTRCQDLSGDQLPVFWTNSSLFYDVVTENTHVEKAA